MPRSRGSPPGCVGRMGRLLDFNQAPPGRKLLADKRYGAISTGQDASSSSFDVTIGMPSVAITKTSSRNEEILYARVPSTGCTTQDMSDRGESNQWPPSVMDGWIGVDTFPACHPPTTVGKPIKGGGMEGSPKNTPSERQHLTENSLEELVHKASSENPTATIIHNIRGYQFSLRLPLDSGGPPLENKEKVGISSKDDSPLVKPNKAKNKTSFLQSNKEFFIRFLHEPKTLFAGHMELNHRAQVSSGISKQESKFVHGKCHIPTQIVVLKPPMQQNALYLSPTMARPWKDSPEARDHNKDTDDTILNEINKKLIKNIEERHDGGRKNDLYEAPRTKDQRETTREIVQQLREKALQDLEASSTAVSSFKTKAFLRMRVSAAEGSQGRDSNEAGSLIRTPCVDQGCLESSSSPSVASKRSIFSRKVSIWKERLFLNHKHIVSNKPVNELQYASDFPSPCHLSRDSRHKSIAREKESSKRECVKDCVSIDSSTEIMKNYSSPGATEIDKDLIEAKVVLGQLPMVGLTTCGLDVGRTADPEVQESNADCVYQCKYIGIHAENPMDSPLTSLGRCKLACLTAEETDRKEECQQPSPVSVLDAPFQEASLMNFEEITTGLKDLRMRLELLKFVDHDSTIGTSNAEDALSASKITITDDRYLVEGGQSVDGIASRLNTCSKRKHLDNIDRPPHESEDFENHEWLVNGIDCPNGKEVELHYVKDLLVASGFSGDNVSIWTRWYAPNQPLDPLLFKKLEDRYHSTGPQLRKHDELATNQGREVLDAQSRHLLFDKINEVLLHLLGPHLKNNIWCMPSCASQMAPMPYGKDLLRSVWIGLNGLACSQSRPQDSLASLVFKDLTKRDEWFDLRIDIEEAGAEIERAIFDDLIEEALLVL